MFGSSCTEMVFFRVLTVLILLFRRQGEQSEIRDDDEMMHLDDVIDEAGDAYLRTVTDPRISSSESVNENPNRKLH